MDMTQREGLSWCPGRGLNPYALFREAADFKSAVSASFTTRAAFDYGLRPHEKGRPKAAFRLA